jgi:hypothetical protein
MYIANNAKWKIENYSKILNYTIHLITSLSILLESSKANTTIRKSIQQSPTMTSSESRRSNKNAYTNWLERFIIMAHWVKGISILKFKIWMVTGTKFLMKLLNLPKFKVSISRHLSICSFLPKLAESIGDTFFYSFIFN